MPQYVIGIDQGTTRTTALVIDEAGTVRARASTALRQHFPHPAMVEHDPEELLTSVLQSIGAALDNAGLSPADVLGLGITNQRETVVIWERTTGRPVHNAIVWQDRRTASRCQALIESGVQDLVRQRTGLVIDPYFSATKIAWLLDHLGLRARAARAELCAGTIDSWLAFRLSGGAVHVSDATNASRTLLFALDGKGFDEELCALFDVPIEILPDVIASEGIVTSASIGPFAEHPVPIAALLGDQQASLLGHCGVKEGDLKNTYGTGAFALSHTGSVPRVDSQKLIATIAYEDQFGQRDFALEGSIFSAGATLDWLRDGLGLLHDVEEAEPLAAGLSSNDDVYLVPALAGLGAPDWDPNARALFIGATQATTRAHLARAALEAIAYQTKDVLDEMQPAASDTPLRVDGGPTNNAWLMQFQSDILGRPIEVAEIRETTALGAGYGAGVALGLFESRFSLEQFRPVSRRFVPQMSRDEAGELYARWLQAKARATSWSHA